MLLLVKLCLAVYFILSITASPCDGFGSMFMAKEAIVQECCSALNSSKTGLSIDEMHTKYPELKNNTDSCQTRLTDYPEYSICINETVIQF